MVRRPDRLGLLPAGADIVPGEMETAAGYRRHLAGCAAVVHCAGVTRARRLAEFRRVNAAGTEALARAASEACPDAMFVHVSSQAAAGPARRGVPVSERDAPDPVSWYGRSKLEGELALARHYRGPWCVVRPSVVYGPGDPGLLPMYAIVARGVAPVIAGGRRRIQLLAAEDLARVLFAAAQRPDLHGRRAFAAGDTVSMGDLGRELAALRTPRARPVAVPAVAVRLLALLAPLWEVATGTSTTFSRDKVRDMLQRDWLCHSAPFLDEVNVTPAVDWREGIRRTCRWYVQARWLARGAFAGV